MSDHTGRAVQAELTAARAAFHRQLAALTPDELARPSRNPAWTNGAVLFHMLLGFLVTLALLPLVWGVSSLPRPVTRPFAALLNALTPVFNALNAFGARMGGRVFRHRSFAATFNAAYAILTWALKRTGERQLERRGMYFPTRWDGLFEHYMSLGNVMVYPARHLQFHVAQLSAREADSHRRVAAGGA